MKFEAKLADGTTVFVPDTEILVDDPSYVLWPAHGHTSLKVENKHGAFIGWMRPETVGYPSVLDWMRARRYIVRCPCEVCAEYVREQGLPGFDE